MTHEFLLLSLVFNLDDRLAALVEYSEWPVLHVRLYFSIVEFTTDQSFGIEDSVVGVLEIAAGVSVQKLWDPTVRTYHGDLILGGISDQTFLVVESDVGWCGSVSLVVGDYLNSVAPEDSHARVRGTEIDSNSRHDECLRVLLCLSVA